MQWINRVQPWPEAVEGALLLNELTETVRRFVVLPEFAAETLALWILHTYAFELREVTAYVGIESPEKRCGKTTLLSVLGELVNRPIAAANISSPAFFRVIEEARPTLLIDEADTFLAGNDELRGILNSGYARNTAYVMRVGTEVSAAEDGEGRTRLERFSSWCPKVMAAIGRLPDTLADRCIVIRMQRKTGREQCARLRQLNREKAETLRRQCARFVEDQAGAIANHQPAMPRSLNDRATDIWEPLLTLADLAGKGWPERSRACATGLMGGLGEEDAIGWLLLDLLHITTAEAGEYVFSRVMVEILQEIGERPWLELAKGKTIDEVWLAKQLRRYGLRPQSVRLKEITAKGYRTKELQEVCLRYIPESEIRRAIEVAGWEKRTDAVISG